MDHIVKALISNTDTKIGNVILSLPVAGIIKTYFPHVKIAYLGQTQSRPLVEQSKFIDEFYDWSEMEGDLPVNQLKNIHADIIFHIYPQISIALNAWKAGVPERVGSTEYWYHWLTCSKKINLNKDNSPLHQAQFHYKFLKPFGIQKGFLLKQLPDFYGWQSYETEDQRLRDDRFNLILHPFSGDHARNWPLTRFLELINELPEEEYNILITGTEEEKSYIETSCPDIFNYEHVQDTTGQLTLQELITLINNADGLVACNSGPLHIAAASGIPCLGIYPPIRPMHPGKWAPVGYRAEYMVRNWDCNVCRKKSPCFCIRKITPQEVYKQITKWKKYNTSKIMSTVNS